MRRGQTNFQLQSETSPFYNNDQSLSTDDFGPVTDRSNLIDNSKSDVSNQLGKNGTDTSEKASPWGLRFALLALTVGIIALVFALIAFGENVNDDITLVSGSITLEITRGTSGASGGNVFKFSLIQLWGHFGFTTDSCTASGPPFYVNSSVAINEVDTDIIVSEDTNPNDQSTSEWVAVPLVHIIEKSELQTYPTNESVVLMDFRNNDTTKVFVALPGLYTVIASVGVAFPVDYEYQGTICIFIDVNGLGFTELQNKAGINCERADFGRYGLINYQSETRPFMMVSTNTPILIPQIDDLLFSNLPISLYYIYLAETPEPVVTTIFSVSLKIYKM